MTENLTPCTDFSGNPTEEITGNLTEETINIKTPWFTLEEAAAYLKLNPRTLKNYVSRGLLPVCVTKTTNTKRFHRDDLDKWLTDGRQNPL
ncbi:hypothetical protein MTBBW1_1150009 [Desulfamplus magnetovallimortis]|uniref:Helix-turn-helix domain-containing protein n=1 Tax=Desulfamplus magnetovallimortis TaxID=1246637 RepID=A0A1W1H5X0_9BACT|nr:helix-turn-helix domain-containing protein [Desulfamplus magnetovallimortis]SLM27836.1 hypothetical protein MTBBW1_1150009 [Desulfamplus magnetovallimortis]